MGKIIVKNAVVRQPGFLYFINGAGDLCEAKMQHGRKKGKKNKKTAKKKPVKKTVKKPTKKKSKK